METLGANRIWVCVAAMTTLFACGGATESNGRQSGDEAGAASVGTGGSSATGGRSGNGGSLGVGGAIPSYGGCCAGTTPYCQAGYVEILSLDACPSASSCYTEAAWCCGGPRYCASIELGVGGAGAGGATASGGTGTGGASANGTGGSCNLLPLCADGYTETTIPCDTSSPFSCYTTNACRLYITCLSSTAKCDRVADYNRHYASANTEICKIYDILCEPYPTLRRFEDACGCGCEQSATCPATVNCMPGSGIVDPLCADAKLCPFTVRAL